jgi:hypothetical protein
MAIFIFSQADFNKKEWTKWGDFSTEFVQKVWNFAFAFAFPMLWKSNPGIHICIYKNIKRMIMKRKNQCRNFLKLTAAA